MKNEAPNGVFNLKQLVGHGFPPLKWWGGEPLSGINSYVVCMVGTPCQKVFQDDQQNNIMMGGGLRGNYQGENSVWRTYVFGYCMGLKESKDL